MNYIKFHDIQLAKENINYTIDGYLFQTIALLHLHFWYLAVKWSEVK